jgi:hypothetical protein
MIQFFRKIRRDLMEKNKTGKYLKYAIGEIVLVVIGILIALSINNWNSKRIENTEEQNVLINLKKDFQLNKENLESVLSDNEKYLKSDLEILNFGRIKSSIKTEAEFSMLLNDLTALSEFFPTNNSLDNLQNSSSISLIKSQELMNKLSSWKPYVESIKDKENTTLELESSGVDFVIKNGSWLNVDEASNIKVLNNYTLPKSRFKVDNRTLLNTIEFENIVENLILHKNELIKTEEKTLILVKEILDLIEEEIKK